MKKWIALLFPFVLALGARAQERIATIVLDDGSQLMGRVVAMDVGSLQLDVRGRIVTVTSARIRSCRIEDAPAEDPATDPAQPQHPSPAPGGETVPSPVPPPPVPVPHARRAPSDPDDENSKEARRRSLFSRRLAQLDKRYPWMAPSNAIEWASLGLTLFALLSFAAHFAAKLSGSEQLRFGNSLALSAWLLASGLAQFAVVPTTPPGVAGMATGNAIAVLVCYRKLYGLGFGGALLATFLLTIMGALVYFAVELVNASMMSIGVSS